MRKSIKSGIAIASVVLGLGVLGTGPAMGAGLQAWNTTGNPTCTGSLTSGSSASYIDVADNLTSCVRNGTSTRYNGMNVVGLFAFQAFSFSTNSTTRELGGANNLIDHFDRN